MEEPVEAEKQRDSEPVKSSKWERRLERVLLLWIGFVASLLLLRLSKVLFVHQAAPPSTPLRPIIAEYTHTDPLDVVNFASKFNGARINYDSSSPQLHGAFSWMSSTALTALLSDDNSPNSCWAFGGSYGHAAIDLAGDILVNSFTLYYPGLVKSDSAPREFKVWATDWPETRLLANGLFEVDRVSQKRQLWQEFSCTEHCGTPVRSVLLEVLSNHGAETTCVYQFQVHGTKLSK